jgi:hypothetical protein
VEESPTVCPQTTCTLKRRGRISFVNEKLWPGFQTTPVECDEITADYRRTPKSSVDGILRNHSDDNKETFVHLDAGHEYRMCRVPTPLRNPIDGSSSSSLSSSQFTSAPAPTPSQATEAKALETVCVNFLLP